MLFTHFSLIILASMLLPCAAFFAVYRSKSNRPARVRTLFYLGNSILFLLMTFLDNSIYPLGYRPFYIAEFPIILVETAAFLELSRNITGVGSRHFNRVYGAFLTVSVSVWLYGFYLAVAGQADHGGPAYSVLLILPIFLLVLSVILLGYSLYRRTSIAPLFLVSSWRALENDDNAGKAVFGLFITSLAYIFGSLSPVLARISDLRVEVLYGSFFANNLVILALIIVTYFLYVERRINLAQKLISFLIVIIMTAFVAVVLAFYTDEEDMPPADVAFFANNSLLFTAASNGQYQAAIAPKSWYTGDALNHVVQPEAVLFDMPFPLQFYGETYQYLAIRPDGQVLPLRQKTNPPIPSGGPSCIWNQPVIAPLCNSSFTSEIRTHSSPDQVVITWADPDARGNSAYKGTAQLVLTKSGQIQFNYDAVPLKASVIRETGVGLNSGAGPFLQNASLSALPLVSANNEALWFDLNYGKRLNVHARLWPVAVFLGVVFVSVVFGFSALLNRMIQQPLESIQIGLHRINEGRLDESLEAHSRDEFGDVAAGFNTMLGSLNKARHRYDEQTELLESELTFRTVEAAKKIDPDILSRDQVFEQSLRLTIEDNLANANFQVAELADAMATSTRQLHRRVVNLTAQTPAALIKNLRLEQGHMLLSAKAVTVSEAAYKVGFRDVSYFSKLFQKKYDITPSDLLKSD